MQIGGFLAIRAGRQIGKSTSLSARQLIYAHIMHKRRSMYIVPHQSFLDTYANRVREMERAFRFYQVHKDFRQNLKYKEYPNESIIQMVKCLMDTQEARSKTTDEVLFDESVHPNTIVYTIEGGKIKERKISEVLAGEKVLAYTNDGNLKEACIRYNKNKGIKHTWKLRFSNGAELICTGNTRFWTSRGWMFLSEFLSWEEAERGANVVKAKSLLAIREAATPGNSSWRRHNKMGREICRVDICGVTNLPRIFDESMLPEAPSNFENAFNSAVVRPALNGFMKHMRVKIEDIKRKSLELPDYNSLPPSIEKPSNPFLT